MNVAGDLGAALERVLIIIFGAGIVYGAIASKKQPSRPKQEQPKVEIKENLACGLEYPTASDSPTAGDPCSFHSAFSVQVIDLINSVKTQLENSLSSIGKEITNVADGLRRDVWWIITIGGGIIGIFCVFVAFMAPRVWSTVTMIDKIESRIALEESRVRATIDWIDTHKMDSIKLDNRVTNLESCVSEMKRRVQNGDKNGGGTW